MSADKDPADTDADESTSAVESTTAVESTSAVEIIEPSEADEPSEVDGTDSAETVVGSGVRGSARRWGRIGIILLAAATVALIASAGLTAWVYYKEYRPDKEVNAEATNGAVEAAKNSSVALLTYSPETLDKDFAAAKANLTGDFLSYYTQFTEQIVTPAAKQKQVKTTASVVRAAASEMKPDSAVVLVFINQVTTSKENPDGAFAASAVKVSLKKIDDRWLIDAFDPV